MVKGLSPETYLEQEEEAGLELVRGVRDDKHASLARQVLAARDDCAHVWVVLAFVYHKVLSAHLHHHQTPKLKSPSPQT